jgi:TPR repeat protein
MGILDGLIKTIDKLVSPLTEERAYQIVSEELAANKIDRGLWTKALAACNFNDGQARALYVKDRVAALHRAALHEQAQQRAWYKKAEINADQHLNNKEYELAFVGFMERAKNKKDPVAMHNLGWLIENKLGTNQPTNDALMWYQVASEHGYDGSTIALSYALYRLGRYKDAFEWANVACQKSVPGAKKARSLAASAAGIKLSWWQK